MPHRFHAPMTQLTNGGSGTGVASCFFHSKKIFFRLVLFNSHHFTTLPIIYNYIRSICNTYDLLRFTTIGDTMDSDGKNRDMTNYS